MVLLSTRPKPTGRRGAVERVDYLIDRFRVGYQFGGGWMCGCADFAARDACRHTREAAGRLAAQMRILAHTRAQSAPQCGDVQTARQPIASLTASLQMSDWRSNE